MNRLKFWLFTLVVIGLAAFALRALTVEQRGRGLDAVDRQLRAAQARAEQSERAATAELAELAGLAAQDAKLQAMLRAGEGESAKPPKKGAVSPAAPSAEQNDVAIDQAAAEAVTGALAATGTARLERVVLAVSRDGLRRKPPPDADAAAYLQDAVEGKVRRGYAVLGEKPYAGASVPVGDRGALAVFVPVDAAWAADKVGDTGAGLVLAVGTLKPVAAGKVDVDALVRSASGAFTPASVGRLAPVDVGPAWLPVKIPPVHSLLLALPGDRAVARPLPGLQGGKGQGEGRMILSLSTRGALEPVVRLEWWGLAGLVLVLLLSIPFGLLVKPSEVAAALPPLLLDAARKIEKGDFSVRAPVLAGKLGTFAAALNKAVDAAQSGAQTPVSSVTSEFFARGPAPAEPADPFAMPVRPPRTTALSGPEPGPELGSAPEAGDDTARLDGSNLTGAAFEAAPVAAPRPAPAPRPAAAPPRPAPSPAPAPPAPAQPAPAPAPGVSSVAVTSTVPAGEVGEEEQHWREVFRDFVRTRAECGESAEGLTYERFRQKLETNKSALVTKYGCKSVRFQVYVKDGKAALKATPVR